MTEEQQRELSAQFESALQDAYVRGLAAGCKIISQNVLNKLNNHKHNQAEAVREIRRFCSTNIRVPHTYPATPNNQKDNIETTEDV